MKIRNQKIVNKLRRSKETIKSPTAISAEDRELETLKEETLTNMPNDDYYYTLLGIFLSLTGIAALGNFLLMYFFDVGVSFYDSDIIFAVLGSIIVYGIASIINRFAIRDLLYSDKSLEEKKFLLEQHNFIKGWKRSLVYCAIAIFSILFAYLGVSLMFVDGEQSTVAYMVFLYAVIMALFEIIKPDKDIPYFTFILLMGFIYLLAQWFITENEIDEYYDNLTDYVSYDLLGIQETYTAKTMDNNELQENNKIPENKFLEQCKTYDGFINPEYTEQAYAEILEGYMPYDLVNEIKQSTERTKELYNTEIHDQPLPEMTPEEAERGFYDIEQIYEKKRNELIK
jgi:hypothetical protein